jgi:hypothetical protein
MPSAEKAGGGNRIQIQSASQLKRLHKAGRFTDLMPDHMKKRPVSAIRAAGGGGEAVAAAGGAPGGGLLEAGGGGAAAELALGSGAAAAETAPDVHAKRDRVEDLVMKRMKKKKQRLHHFGNNIETRWRNTKYFNLCVRYQPGGQVPAHKELLAEEARQLELFRAAMDTSRPPSRPQLRRPRRSPPEGRQGEGRRQERRQRWRNRPRLLQDRCDTLK